MTTETIQNDAPAAAAETVATTALGDAAAAETETTSEAEGEVKPAAEAAPEVPTILGAPEAYDTAAFAMPEGIEFDGALFDAVKDDLKGLDLSQDGAGKIVGLFAEKVVPMIQARAEKAMNDAALELSANLARDLQADPEVGGKMLKESQAHAAKAIAHFIPDATERSDFSTFLNESGLGNHPKLTRVIAGAGKLLGEATTLAAATASAPQSEAQKFYGKS